MSESKIYSPSTSKSIQDEKADKSNDTNKSIERDESILEEFNPVPYVFVLKDKMHKEIFLPTNEMKRVLTECPPFHVLLDHLMAVLWCYYSKQGLDLLGTAQIHWALKILEAVKDRHGQSSEDVKMAIRHLTDTYMNICNQVDERALEKSRTRQKSTSFHQSSRYDGTKHQPKKEDMNSTKVTQSASEKPSTDSENRNPSSGKEVTISLSDDEEYQMFAKGITTRSSGVSLHAEGDESAMNFTFHKNDKTKNNTELVSLHLTDMLEDKDPNVLAELLGLEESETAIVSPQQPETNSPSHVSSDVKKDMEQMALAKKAKDLTTVLSLLEEVKRIDSVLQEIKLDSNPEATAKLKALIESGSAGSSKELKKDQTMATVIFSDESTINDSAEARELQKLLEAAEDIENHNPPQAAVPKFREDATFAKELTNVTVPNKTSPKKPSYQTEELDSSDEEGVKNFLERKYNEYGRDINQKLKQDQAEKRDASINKYVNSSFSSALKNSMTNNNNDERNLSKSFNSKPVAKPVMQPVPIEKLQPPKEPYCCDPVFGLRIIRPLVSGAVLKERMEGRTPVGMSSVVYHLERGDLSKDWVIAGVIINKSPVKKTKNGDHFSIWKLSDLKGDIKTVSLFLFRTAHKDLWKTSEGVVIAVLNPGVFDSHKDRNDVAALTIDTPQKVMILGQSKDFGTCKSKKKNGDPCTAIVNTTDCEFCVYHVKQEFNRMSQRSELQSSTAGRGLQDLRNKVLGKSEVFYAGRSYTAVPAKKSVKQTARDEKRLMTLSEYYQSPFANQSQSKEKKQVAYASPVGPISKSAGRIEANAKQRLKDLERLKMLNGTDDQTQQDASSSLTQASVPEKYQNRSFSFTQLTPTLSQSALTVDIDLSAKKANLAKMNAIATLKKKPVEKTDPNFIKYRGTVQGKKRAIDLMNEDTEAEAKRRKTEEFERKSRIQKIIDATSSHTNLIKSREDEEREKYFNKMEKKEALEEKMLNTFKMPCKAVICSKCKYTAFSAADRCKEERHPLKVIDAEKRFFECQDCGNRTVTVHKLPKVSCKNCSSSRWKRTAMIREKKIHQGAELSVRGDEEKFLGSVANSANLNLLVPVED